MNDTATAPTPAQLALAAARRPLFNALVAPLAAGPILADEARALLDTYTAALQRVEAEFLHSLHPGVYEDAGRHTADGVRLCADAVHARADATAPAPARLPGPDLTPWAAQLAADGLVPEAATPTAWADDEARLRVHLAFAADVPQHDREQVTDAITAFVRTALH